MDNGVGVRWTDKQYISRRRREVKREGDRTLEKLLVERIEGEVDRPTQRKGRIIKKVIIRV